MGFRMELVIGSVYPPLTSLRHEYIARLRSPIHYAPPQEILKILERDAKTARSWPHAPFAVGKSRIAKSRC